MEGERVKRKLSQIPSSLTHFFLIPLIKDLRRKEHVLRLPVRDVLGNASKGSTATTGSASSTREPTLKITSPLFSINLIKLLNQILIGYHKHVFLSLEMKSLNGTWKRSLIRKKIKWKEFTFDIDWFKRHCSLRLRKCSVGERRDTGKNKILLLLVNCNQINSRSKFTCPTFFFIWLKIYKNTSLLYFVY